MSLWHLTRGIVETARISIPTAWEALWGRLTLEATDRRLMGWSERLLAQAEMSLSVEGLSLLPQEEAFVVMSNHQSLYDIPVMFQSLRRRLRMVAKRELFRVPVWSQAMRAAGFVEVDRGNRERAILSLRRAEEALHSGTNIWIAPEGTRSPSGRLAQFKSGGFHLAIATGARILPVTIDGTRNALVARGFTVRNGAQVRVIASTPIDPNAYGVEGRQDLIQDVRTAIAAHLPEERRLVSERPEWIQAVAS